MDSQVIAQCLRELTRQRFEIDQAIEALNKILNQLANPPRMVALKPYAAPEEPQGHRRGRPPGGEGRKPKAPAPKVKLAPGDRPTEKSYFVSQKHVLAILGNSSEPLSTYRIKQELEAKLNIVPSDNALLTVLKAAKERKAICSPQSGEWAICND